MSLGENMVVCGGYGESEHTHTTESWESREKRGTYMEYVGIRNVVF